MRGSCFSRTWRSVSGSCLLLVGLLAVTASAEAQTSTLPATADTYLKSGSPNQSQGSETLLRIQSSGNNRSLVRFDPAAIAAAVGNGRLAEARLELYIQSNSNNWGSEGRTVDAHRLTADWTEAGATWNCGIDSIPGNSQANCSPQWAGGLFEEEPSDTVLHTNGLTGWIRFDVTADVRAFLSSTPNDGWLVKKTEEGQNGQVDYTSRQGAADRAPRLVLVVESAAFDEVPPSLAITAPSQAVVINDATPEIRIEYADGGSGVDLTSLRVLVDAADISGSCTTGAASATCEPPPLAAGSHTVHVTLSDQAGNESQVSFAFELLVGPGLHTVTFPAVADTYLRQGSPNQSQGSESFLRIQRSGKNRSLVRFGQAAIASALGGTTLRSAHLELYVQANGDNWGASGRMVDIHRLTSAWTESGATWSCADDSNPTNQQADCTSQWNGGAFTATATASVLHKNGLRGWISFDVTSDLAAFLGGSSNDGWLLKKSDEGQSGRVDYTSRTGVAGQAPRLVVMFETAVTDATPPTITITSPADGSFVSTATPTLNATYSDAESGVDPASVRLVLDGVDRTAEAQVTAEGVTLSPSSPLASGVHTVAVIVRDMATNESHETASFTIDLDPPLIVLTAPAEGSFLNISEVQVTGTVTDDVQVTSVAVNDIETTLDAGAFQATVPLEEGFNAIFVVATDASGRRSFAARKVTLDRTPPTLTVETPTAGQLTNQNEIRVAGETTDEGGIASLTIQGELAPVIEDRFEAVVPVGSGSNQISLRARDRAGNETATVLQVTRFDLPEVTITSPEDLSFLAVTTIDVSGTVNSPGATVTVNGTAAVVSGTTFTAHEVPLIEGGNILTATATDTSGHVGIDSINVVRDLTAPHLAIHYPKDGATLFEPTVTVSGMVNDIVAGTVNASEATVTVNGRPASVSNRSFVVEGVPLSTGDNILTAVATDASGNMGDASISVHLAAADVPRLAIVSGNHQEAVIGIALPAPLTVSLLDAAGLPVVGKPVLFKLRGNNGSLDGGKRQIAVTTDAAGRASAHFTLGTRAGVGNQVVEATSPGFAGPAVFTATARAGEPTFLVVDAGDQQVGIAGQELPRPLVVVVTDAGHNRLEGALVRIKVVEGAGHFANGLREVLVFSDSDGRVILPFALDPEEGIANNVVGATIEGLEPSPVASFVASGRAAGDSSATSISGVVLDNSNLPIAGVTLRILDSPLTARTDEAGLFRIAGAPVGTVRLIVDGSTVERPGSWPDLEFVLTTIPGRDNTVNMPIYLLPLNLANGIPVDETHGGTLTLPEIPGFALEVLPGSVTFPGGSRSGVVSVTAVHGDKVPMVPNFGQQPRFIVTIQPAGARFDPPARLTLPNVEGLAPGEVTEMYSFDHDLGHFVSIGPATVSENGAVIISNPAVGIIKAGWHCGGNPATAGTPHNCKDCYKCVGDACVPEALCKACTPAGKACNGKGHCQTGKELVPIPTVCEGLGVKEERQRFGRCSQVPGLEEVPDLCGAALSVDYVEVTHGCDGIDLEGAEWHEEIESDFGCGNAGPIDTNRCAVTKGNKLAPVGQVCRDYYYLCRATDTFPFNEACTEIWTQKIYIDDCLVETKKITFTIVHDAEGCAGFAERN